MKDEVSIEINAKPDKIFPYLVNREKFMQYVDKSAGTIELDYQSDVKVGDTMTVTPKRGGSAWKIGVRCKELVPDKVLAWEFYEGPLSGEERISLTSTGEKTTVRRVTEYELKGFSKRLLWALVARRMRTKSSRGELDRMKGFVETT